MWIQDAGYSTMQTFTGKIARFLSQKERRMKDGRKSRSNRKKANHYIK